MTTAQALPSSRLERRKARTRASILEAAARLFSERGYDDTSIALIAEQADAGVGTVYGYFESKAEILQEVLLEHSRVAIAGYLEGIDATTPHIDRIISALATYAGWLRENRTLLRAAFSSSIISSDNPEINGQRLLYAFEDMLKSGMDAGELRQLPAATTSALVLGTYAAAFLGIAPWAHRQNDPALPGELETIVRGMLAVE